MSKISTSHYKSHKILISTRARKSIDNLPKEARTIIISKIEALTSDLTNLDIKKLQGHKDLYRIRAGDYRIVFQVSKNQQLIIVALVAHRKEIYSLIKNLTGLS
ncbi:MAG: type II toxin-antitoxin system RelE/ParE family toxin [Candidatus Babeliales bacterium]